MKNAELIASAAVEAGVYTDDEVKRIISGGGKLPLHTATAWNEYVKSSRGDFLSGFVFPTHLKIIT